MGFFQILFSISYWHHYINKKNNKSRSDLMAWSFPLIHTQSNRIRLLSQFLAPSDQTWSRTFWTALVCLFRFWPKQVNESQHRSVVSVGANVLVHFRFCQTVTYSMHVWILIYMYFYYSLAPKMWGGVSLSNDQSFFSKAPNSCSNSTECWLKRVLVNSWTRWLHRIYFRSKPKKDTCYTPCSVARWLTC